VQTQMIWREKTALLIGRNEEWIANPVVEGQHHITVSSASSSLITRMNGKTMNIDNTFPCRKTGYVCLGALSRNSRMEERSVSFAVLPIQTRRIVHDITMSHVATHQLPAEHIVARQTSKIIFARFTTNIRRRNEWRGGRLLLRMRIGTGNVVSVDVPLLDGTIDRGISVVTSGKDFLWLVGIRLFRRLQLIEAMV